MYSVVCLLVGMIKVFRMDMVGQFLCEDVQLYVVSHVFCLYRQFSGPAAEHTVVIVGK